MTVAAGSAATMEESDEDIRSSKRERSRPGKLAGMASPYRDLPSVEELTSTAETQLPRSLVVWAARSSLDAARENIGRGEAPELDRIFGSELRRLEAGRTSRVVNATGVLLHTNLGRATLSERATSRAQLAQTGPANVELDVTTGSRRTRGAHAARLLCLLTGAEDALVVNNNASALLLTLAALARGRSVPVSRGEMIEIGGSYRLPSIMEVSGARLVEVGTTNRTRLGDYDVALQTHDVGCILKVHPSNYTIDGFVADVSVAELATLRAGAGVPLVHDIGSGLLDSEAGWVPGWLSEEPGVRQSIEAGANLALFSGDKLLGGPQAGIIVGDKALVAALRSSPMARALRVDGPRYAALEATLEAYVDGTVDEIPFWRSALRSLDELRPRAEAVAAACDGRVEAGDATVGAGSAPGSRVPSLLVRVPGGQDLFEALLAADPPILARRDAGDLLIDLRTFDADHDDHVIATLDGCR